ncbi:MAG TPA: DinB family protein [Chloroflexia bacterium]
MQALETLFQHNLWANMRLMEACRDLDDAVLDSIVPGTYGTVRDTLGHIARAEAGYYRRLTGKEVDRTGWGEVPTLEQLTEALRFTGEGLIQAAPGVRESDTLQVEWQGEKVEFPTGIILLQAINHATEHRSHIATILTQQGITPPDMDGWSYIWSLKGR